jgi:hypothetical protein
MRSCANLPELKKEALIAAGEEPISLIGPKDEFWRITIGSAAYSAINSTQEKK